MQLRVCSPHYDDVDGMILTCSPDWQQKHNHVHCTIEHINELEHPVVLLDPIYISKSELRRRNEIDGKGRDVK